MKIYTGSVKQELVKALKYASRVPHLDQIVENSEWHRPDDMEHFKKKLNGYENKNTLGSHIELTTTEMNNLVEYLHFVRKYGKLAYDIMNKKTKINTIDDVKGGK